MTTTQRFKNEDFKVSREVLKSKRRELRKQVKGNKPNAKVALTNVQIECVFEENQFCAQFCVRSTCVPFTSSTKDDTK